MGKLSKKINLSCDSGKQKTTHLQTFKISNIQIFAHKNPQATVQ